MNHLAGIFGLTLLFSACQGSPRAAEASPAIGVGPVSEAAPVAAPMALDGGASSTWQYLLSKYDGDGDQRIEPGEYGRDRERFARLDRDRDGVLTAADFPALDRASLGGTYRDLRAERALAEHFQADDDDGELRLDELEWMITTYDADLDESIGAAEFATGAAEYRRALDDGDASGTQRAMMGEYDPWEALVEAADRDENGRLATAELVAFFQARSRGSQVLSLKDEGEGQVGRGTSGVPEGEPAPDFSLEPPHGTERVRLSSFRGQRPVALIFGSYT